MDMLTPREHLIKHHAEEGIADLPPALKAMMYKAERAEMEGDTAMRDYWLECAARRETEMYANGQLP